MPRSRNDTARTLADNWFPPVRSPAGEVGHPLICVASTYTFHAPFFESDLLPRFLGLKFDETESVRPFVVEREQALATSRVCVLVDADHLDPSQSTLRWDQLPVRVPGGVQHSKVALLLWENYARLIVSSANITRPGYRRNREIAGVVDFYDHESSAPRKLVLDALAFIQDLSTLVRASHGAKSRMRQAVEDARTRVRSWRQMAAEFRPLERPRAAFVGGLPRIDGRSARSPISQLLELWGTRRASEIIVMTPFAGDLVTTVNPVVEKLREVPQTQGAIGSLIVPGQPSEGDTSRVLVGLPRHFLESWASSWHVEPSAVPTYVVPRCRTGEMANRDLHAKGILLVGDNAALMMCGSSNFSQHGMGVDAANAEANLCYLDDPDTKRNEFRLKDRLPVDWTNDFCERALWPDTAEPIEDERAATDVPLPGAFLWAVYNQRTAILTIAVDPESEFPSEWSLRLPGEHAENMPPLMDHGQVSQLPPDGRIVRELPGSLRGVSIAGLRLEWRDREGTMQCATLPVHVETSEDLLPPEEFRSLTLEGILDCLLSGRDPAEWIDALENQAYRKDKTPPLDPLHSVDTSGYLLYRTRRFGAALAALAERLLRTVRTRDAIAYRLRQDPLGPQMLAETMVCEWRKTSNDNGANANDPGAVLFSLAEIKLMLAYVAREIPERHLRPLFHEVVREIDRLSDQIVSISGPLPPNLSSYRDAVSRQCDRLLEPNEGGIRNAD